MYFARVVHAGSSAPDAFADSSTLSCCFTPHLNRSELCGDIVFLPHIFQKLIRTIYVMNSILAIKIRRLFKDASALICCLHYIQIHQRVAIFTCGAKRYAGIIVVCFFFFLNLLLLILPKTQLFVGRFG